MSKCDMCSAPNPTWEYPANNFLATPISVSEGSWIVCDECAALIERREREALVQRAVDAIIALNPHLAHERDWCLFAARQVHAGFWANRTGSVRAERREVTA